MSAPPAAWSAPRAVPACVSSRLCTLSADRSPCLQARGVPAVRLAGERAKMCAPSDRAAGRAVVESGLPPALAAAVPLWGVHLLELV